MAVAFLEIDPEAEMKALIKYDCSEVLKSRYERLNYVSRVDSIIKLYQEKIDRYFAQINLLEYTKFLYEKVSKRLLKENSSDFVKKREFLQWQMDYISKLISNSIADCIIAKNDYLNLF